MSHPISSVNRQVSAIAAMDQRRVIGFNGKLPWHVPADLKHFAAATSKQAVLMGRATWESLDPQYRPLPGRTNIVVSRRPGQLQLPAGVIAGDDCRQLISQFRAGQIAGDKQQLWIVGGAQIYAAALPYCDHLVLTLIPGDHQGDTYFPPFEEMFKERERKQLEGCEVVYYSAERG